ncbi:ATP-binding protein [Candidatus Riflebacteria bacterium]
MNKKNTGHKSKKSAGKEQNISIISKKQTKNDGYGKEKGNRGWKVLIVDDIEGIHSLTRMVLEDFFFEGKGLIFLSAYAAADARKLLRKHPDIAVILLDVLMEEDDSGLKLVNFVRKELKNSHIQIIIRTGQPGQVPEQKVITEYEINDYKTKAELTAHKLYSTLLSALRAYGVAHSLSQVKEKLYLEQSKRRRAEQSLKSVNTGKTESKDFTQKSLYQLNNQDKVRISFCGILNTSRLLLRDNYLTPRQREFIGGINFFAQDVFNYLGDLSEQENSSEGNENTGIKEFELKGLLLEVFHIFQELAENKGLSLRLENLPRNYLEVIGEEEKLRIILLTLLGDAIFETEKGEVLFNVKIGKNSLYTFEISDTGPGKTIDIPQIIDFTCKEFEPDTPGSVRAVGLALSKVLVSELGGTLNWQAKKKKGSKASFAVNLPPAS